MSSPALLNLWAVTQLCVVRLPGGCSREGSIRLLDLKAKGVADVVAIIEGGRPSFLRFVGDTATLIGLFLSARTPFGLRVVKRAFDGSLASMKCSFGMLNIGAVGVSRTFATAGAVAPVLFHLDTIFAVRMSVTMAAFARDFFTAGSKAASCFFPSTPTLPSGSLPT